MSGTFELNDGLIEEMVRGWPNAGFMQLCNFSSLHAAKLTFRELASLVQHCPKVQEIVLSFTATTPHPGLLDSIIHGKTTNNNITRLDTSWSAIETSDPSLISLLLIALFPNL